MKKLFAVTALTITGMTGAAFADALDDAEERGVCGVGFEPISAEYLPDGRLKALCPAGSGAAAAAAGSTVVGGAGGAGVLGGTALAGGGAVAAGVAGLAAIAVIAGSNDTTTTTTTTN